MSELLHTHELQKYPQKLPLYNFVTVVNHHIFTDIELQIIRVIS